MGKKGNTKAGKKANKPTLSVKQESGEKKKSTLAPSDKGKGSKTGAAKPYSKSERRKNRIKLDETDSREEYATQRAIDTGAEDILRKPKKTDESDNTPVPPAKEPISPKKRKLKRVLFYTVTIAILLSVCLLLSLTIFFKIDEITVEGKTRYPTDEIIASSMIKKGENLILCNTSPGAEKIISKFAYIEKADIKKKLFNKVIINVTEATPTSIVERNGKYYVLSESGKIIEINEEKKYNVPIILGVELENEKIASYAEYKNKEVEKYVQEIIDRVEHYGIKNIETIDITNLSNITLIRRNGLKIIIGTPENIDYKIKTAKTILDKSVKDNDIGSLDVSLSDLQGGKSYLNVRPEPSKEESSKKPEESKVQTSKAESSQESSEETSKESSAPQETSVVEESTEESEISETTEYTYDDTDYTDDTDNDDTDNTDYTDYTDYNDNDDTDNTDDDNHYDDNYGDDTDNGDDDYAYAYDNDDTDNTDDNNNDDTDYGNNGDDWYNDDAGNNDDDENNDGYDTEW